MSHAEHMSIVCVSLLDVLDRTLHNVDPQVSVKTEIGRGRGRGAADLEKSYGP